MYLSTESVCRITGIAPSHYYILRRYLRPNMKPYAPPRKGRGRAKKLYPLTCVVDLLDSLHGGVDRDTVRRLFEAAEPIEGVTA